MRYEEAVVDSILQARSQGAERAAQHRPPRGASRSFGGRAIRMIVTGATGAIVGVLVSVN